MKLFNTNRLQFYETRASDSDVEDPVQSPQTTKTFLKFDSEREMRTLNKLLHHVEIDTKKLISEVLDDGKSTRRKSSEYVCITLPSILTMSQCQVYARRRRRCTSRRYTHCLSPEDSSLWFAGRLSTKARTRTATPKWRRHTGVDAARERRGQRDAQA